MRWICAAAAVLLSVSQAAAEDGGGLFNWVHGDWYLTVGGAGYIAPKYNGDNTYEFTGQPLISLGKAGEEARFISRNDEISLSLFDRGSFRFGAAGNFIWKQDDGTSDDLTGPFRGAVRRRGGHLRRGLPDRVAARPRRAVRGHQEL